MCKHPAIYLLEALIIGNIVSIDGNDYQIVNDKLYCIKNHEEIPVEMSIEIFIKLSKERK